MIRYFKCHSTNEIKQIYKLQKENLASALSPEQLKKEGFVTCDHSIELLTKMNTPWNHTIALDELSDTANPKLAGYALVMLPHFEKDFKILRPMFDEFRRIKIGNKPLSNSSFFVMGQICVAKEYRGQGVVQGLYTQMKSQMESEFEFVVTEVALSNPCSLRAHEKIGFKTIKEYQTERGDKWAIIMWGWSVS